MASSEKRKTRKVTQLLGEKKNSKEKDRKELINKKKGEQEHKQKQKKIGK